MKNEKTSKRVATIAGKILKKLKDNPRARQAWVDTLDQNGRIVLTAIGEACDIEAIAASALTQTANKGKRK